MAHSSPFDTSYELYDSWFEKNSFLYDVELQAVKSVMPSTGRCLEVGVGTARFAAPLGISFGIDPSEKMTEISRARGISVVRSDAEHLPFKEDVFDCALMITTICFVDDPAQSLSEIWRVLKQGGMAIVGFVDRKSRLGKEYQAKKENSTFYQRATFYSVDDVTGYLCEAHFHGLKYRQSLLSGRDPDDRVIDGYGMGSFVVITGIK